MLIESEKRGSDHRIDTSGEPVGGRQIDPIPSAGGGGYLDVCNFAKFRERDPRLDEFAEMGLPRVWLDVAELIGADNFLAMWRRLDAEDAFTEREGRLIVKLRRYGSYQRYQRNRYIESLAKTGMTAVEISRRVSRQLCEQISVAHIRRLAKNR